MTSVAFDLRDAILRSVAGRTVVAAIIADDDGVLAETGAVEREARRLGLAVERLLGDGTSVRRGEEIARLRGTPKQVALAEEVLIGLMAKPSGIATAARRFVERAGERPAIVSGAWKKMPATEKEAIRRAVVVGGAFYRMSRKPFAYLDKNYVRMLGGIRASLDAVVELSGHEKVVQLKGAHGDIAAEAREAVEGGADLLHVDTGCPDDVRRVSKELARLGRRGGVRIAFSGNVRLEDVDGLKLLDIDVLDVGRQIVDAPLLDMRLEVQAIGEEPSRNGAGSSPA